MFVNTLSLLLKVMVKFILAEEEQAMLSHALLWFLKITFTVLVGHLCRWTAELLIIANA